MRCAFLSSLLLTYEFLVQGLTHAFCSAVSDNNKTELVSSVNDTILTLHTGISG